MRFPPAAIICRRCRSRSRQVSKTIGVMVNAMLREGTSTICPRSKPCSEHLRSHYRHWADMDIPALGGKAPRQAMRTKDGRELVEALLRDFERRVAHQPGLDQEIFDELRASLGIGRAQTGSEIGSGMLFYQDITGVLTVADVAVRKASTTLRQSGFCQ